MTRAWVGEPHFGWRETVSLKRGSSYSVKALSEPTGDTESRPIGFRVSQSRENRGRQAAALVASVIQATYQ